MADDAELLSNGRFCFFAEGTFLPKDCRRDLAHEESDDMIDHDADQVPDPLEIKTFIQGSVPD